MYVVTGGAGFIGSAVIWKLNNIGVDDILVVDDLGESEKWKNLVNRHYTDYIHKSDFLKFLAKDKFNKIDAIIHMGACSSTTEKNADFLMQNNYHYSVSLAKFALKMSVRFINASSAATYGDGSAGFSDSEESMQTLKPLNMYGYSKHLFDMWALRSNLLNQLASLKFFNVFGPNEYHKDHMCSLFYKGFVQARQTGRIRLFKSYRKQYADGDQRRDFVYIKDCVNLIWWLVENPSVNGVLNVGTGQDRSWNDLAKAVFTAMKLPLKIEYIDMPGQLRDRYQYFTRANVEKLSASGWPMHFTSLEAAANDYIVNYLQQKDIYL
jgi:ADP-L-glycero-D-manno-heptose 6-epimerase